VGCLHRPCSQHTSASTSTTSSGATSVYSTDQGGRGERASAGGVHRGGVDAPLQRAEVESPVAVDDELAVKDGAGADLLGERGGDLGEVAGERAALPGL
jgi:hypothetical protein